MSQRIRRSTVLALLRDDIELCEYLCELGVMPRDEAQLLHEHLEAARVAGTLVHELEVNYAGVEVILRMRSELVATRRQIAQLIAELRGHARTPEP